VTRLVTPLDDNSNMKTTKQLIEKQIDFFERMVKQHPQIKDHQERLKYYQDWLAELT